MCGHRASIRGTEIPLSDRGTWESWHGLLGARSWSLDSPLPWSAFSETQLSDAAALGEPSHCVTG